MAAKQEASNQYLGRRIAVMIALCLMGTMLAMVGLSIILERGTMTAAFEKQTKIATELLATNIGGAVKFKKADKVEEGVAAFLNEMSEEVRWLAAVDAEGQVIFEVGTNPQSKAHISKFVEGAASLETMLVGPTAKAQPIAYGPKNALVGGLIIDWSHDGINAATITNAIIVGVLGLLAGVCGAVLCMWRLNLMVVPPAPRHRRRNPIPRKR